MLTDNEIKERLSRAFTAMIIHRSGHKVNGLDDDHGTDIQLIEMTHRISKKGEKRITESGRMWAVQLKATTEGSIIRSNGVVKYKLENKTYNDLVDRISQQVPLILFLFVLPEDKGQWVECTTNELIARQHVYWYTVPSDATKTDNEKSRTTINIPDTQRLDLTNLPKLFKLL